MKEIAFSLLLLLPVGTAVEQTPPGLQVAKDVAAILTGMLEAPSGLEAVRQIMNKSDRPFGE